MQINYSMLDEKIRGYEKFSIGEKYKMGELVVKALSIGDKVRLAQILKETGIESLYEKACDKVDFETKQGMRLVPMDREMFLIFRDESKDNKREFFEICELAEKLGKSALDKLVIIGYFMNQERMNIIQAYQILTGAVI